MHYVLLYYLQQLKAAPVQIQTVAVFLLKNSPEYDIIDNKNNEQS